MPSYFVERPEVSDAIKAKLLSKEPNRNGVLVVSAIHGLGGIGKSTVAIALAHDEEIREYFCDGILWVILGQEPEKSPHILGKRS